MVQRHVRVLAGIAAGVALVACLGTRTAASQADGLVVSLAADAARYRPGQPVRLTVTVRNASTAPLTLQYRSGQRFDVLATREGAQVWRWSEGRVFTQMVSEQTLAPGESRTMGTTWDQKGADGAQVPPGRYTLVGRSTSVPGGDAGPITIELLAAGATSDAGTVLVIDAGEDAEGGQATDGGEGAAAEVSMAEGSEPEAEPPTGGETAEPPVDGE